MCERPASGAGCGMLPHAPAPQEQQRKRNTSGDTLLVPPPPPSRSRLPTHMGEHPRRGTGQVLEIAGSLVGVMGRSQGAQRGTGCVCVVDCWEERRACRRCACLLLLASRQAGSRTPRSQDPRHKVSLLHPITCSVVAETQCSPSATPTWMLGADEPGSRHSHTPHGRFSSGKSLSVATGMKLSNMPSEHRRRALQRRGFCDDR